MILALMASVDLDPFGFRFTGAQWRQLCKIGWATRADRDGKKAGMNVAKTIEFYKPHSFLHECKWIPAEQRSKILLFVPDRKTKLAAGIDRIKHDEHCGGSTSLISSAKPALAKYES